MAYMENIWACIESSLQTWVKDEETALIAADFSEGDSCEEAYSVLPSLRVNDQVYLGKVELMQHSTEPPVRYSEGSLVKKLEELGIGRPSTYASVIKVLQSQAIFFEDGSFIDLLQNVKYSGRPLINRRFTSIGVK
ncbi:hypothetical protein QJS04_geneDACA006677 [Acorus gramineus]|uniref:Topo IA-type catalytic domain-containing protein n=1 Tax=Acorus gramineus TaxID=55184 RepID=A0AAV9AUW7_ACOGR|nr:hypothetical protein QJS04_geneDACA006677 [Acorus gramineus]